MAVTSQPVWQFRDPERYRRAYELLMMEQPRDRVAHQIAMSGLSTEDATALVAEAWEAGRGDRRGEGRTEIMRGVGVFSAGLLATVFLSSVLSAFGWYVLFWGAILYGIFDIVRGLKKLSS